MKGFNVGDRVKFIYEPGFNGGRLVAGSIGTVATSRANVFGNLIGVVWDECMGGHDLDGMCEYGYGWWLEEEYIVPYEEVLFEPASEAELEKLLFDE